MKFKIWELYGIFVNYYRVELEISEISGGFLPNFI
jgi:hypothetical protein